MNEIKIFSPATVANISCGFDVLGLCLDTVGDEMVVRKTKDKKITITKITGHDLPYEPENNVAGVAALSLFEHLQPDCGFEIEIHKKIKPGSGIGSSAASASGTVFAMNELLGKPLSNEELVPFAMKGEELASKAWHADNVAPVLLGNFTLIRSYEPLDIISINAPDNLYATVIHPQVAIKTSEARGVMPKSIELKKAIKQTGNMGGLISGLFTSDYELIGRSLHDEFAEPYRASLIPNFNETKEASLQAGALGCGISGSGPSIYALSKGKEIAEKVGKAMENCFKNTTINYEIHVSKINTQGIKTLESN
ncbi:homoserine kinase [Tenacibaculum sp. M341]|uniref:homoserine kinase n=1 Tax=Tenacibaculum sp. M341 TaxID=2530339 RepID=UPI0010440821|nr:homoserine kinase [Tenacibaculum sp. M341]TCI84722.1 homoserine kinase [Tenacibaculum sp. M341]